MEKEIKISLFDPTVNAYREVSVELAKKFLESSKKVEKQLKNLEK